MSHPPAPTPSPTWRQALGEWTRAIVFAVVLWLLVRTFVVEAFKIPSPSMEPTLLVGDHLFVNKAVYGPEIPFTGVRLPAVRAPARGDLVIFDSVEEEGKKVVKRLIGVPGDTLAMHGGVLYRDGVLVQEPYVRNAVPAKTESPEFRLQMRAWQLPHLVGDTAGYDPDLHDWGPLVVPPDSFLMLGDNRDDSYDGRYWGFLPKDHVRGTPLFIYYSFDPSSWHRLPAFTAVRWDRIFSRPR
jgi:signal peptidase I